MPKVIYTYERAIKDVVDGLDNTAIKAMIKDFREFLVDLKPLTTTENGSKFNTTAYQGFEFSEEMLHTWVDTKNAEALALDPQAETMSYWGNLLAMMQLVQIADNGVSSIWDVKCMIEINDTGLDSTMPSFMPNSTDIIEVDGEEVEVPKLWRNWKSEGVKEKSNRKFLVGITDGRTLNSSELLSLKNYIAENPSYGMKFLSYKEFRDI